MIRVRYDFTADGGATTNVVQLAKALEDLVVTHVHVVVKTAVTSGGSGTVSIGTTTDTVKFVGLTDGAVANLVTGAVLGPTTSENIPYWWKSGDYLIVTVGTAALLTGVFDVFIEVMKP